MERFWVKVNKRGPVPERRPKLGRCWVWTAGKIPQGYGSFNFNGKRQLGAHRVAWFLTYGEWPKGQLNHRCDNRACVRPSHLEDVGCRENLLDSPLTRASINAAKTHCPKGHEYTSENTYTWRGLRGCKECRRCSSREYQRRRAAERRLRG